MKNKLFLLPLSAAMLLVVACNGKTPSGSPYIEVSDYVDTSGQTPCSDILQKLINDNPHSTLHFRNGIYLLNKQIATPGDPDKSVDLKLDNYAVLRASDNYQAKREGEEQDWEEWQDQYLYMVSLGGLDRINDVTKIGSIYGMDGGVVDGNGIAGGVEIAGGRESKVKNVSMKNVEVGLKIAKGVNSGSSDADVTNVDIICNETVDSYGIVIDGFDNTITNSRIGHTQHGVKINGGGNMLRNIHPLCNGNISDTDYLKTYGFEINNQNYLDYCYSDNFVTAFSIGEGKRSVFNDCFAWWYNPHKTPHTMIDNNGGNFTSIFTNLSCGFHDDIPDGQHNAVLKNAVISGSSASAGVINNIAINNRYKLSDDDLYKRVSIGADVDY
ncbi:MAG: hypothetical protein MJ206_03605 [Bacilli bacterium]|nr:hypothetical protein [Bacilli bacterium]